MQPSASIRVRPAGPADAGMIAGFQIEMARETESLALDPATVRRGVQAVFNDPAKGRYWLAECDGQVAGCMMATPEWSDWRNGTVLWIQSLYVPPAFRRRGVFGALYAHLKALVRQDAGLMGIRLYVDRRNRAAQEAYERVEMDGEHYRLYEWMR